VTLASRDSHPVRIARLEFGVFGIDRPPGAPLSAQMSIVEFFMKKYIVSMGVSSHINQLVVEVM
jgi:hypothetical protein